MGMRTAGPACCCCPDFWVYSTSGGEIAWRGLHNSGEFPSNEVKIDVDPHATPFGQRMTVDYRNKKVYVNAIKQSDTTKMELVEYDFHFANRRVVHEYSRKGAPASPALACDYNSGRLYYVKWIKFEEGVSHNEFEQQIWRVNYDGTDDTLLVTEAWTEVAIGQVATIGNLTWEPTENRLYYSFTEYAYVGVPLASDINAKAFLKRCSADDGSGLAALVALFDTVTVHGDYFVTGIGTFPAIAKLFWIERHSTSVGSDWELKIADLGCAGAAAVFSDSFIGSITYTRCFPSEKDQRIYFEKQHFPSEFGGQEVRALMSVEQNGDDLQTEFHNRQGAWNNGNELGGSMRPGQTLQAKLACKRELTGASFSGSGYS